MRSRSHLPAPLLALSTLVGGLMLAGCPAENVRECGPFMEAEACTCPDGTQSVLRCDNGWEGECSCGYYYDPPYYDDTYYDYDGGYYDTTYDTSVECTEEYEEVCDGVDNDCDGSVDEGDVCGTQACYDGMTYVNWLGSAYCIFTYEASRPDATASNEGTDVRYPRSWVGVQPWRWVNYDEARQACTRAGMRLCEASEWIGACAGPDGWRYPYGPSAFDAGACGGDAGRFATCGTNADCTTVDGIVDMTGNLAEWASDGRAHGGSYGNAGDDEFLSCDPDALPGYSATSGYSTVGFRCCSAPL